MPYMLRKFSGLSIGAKFLAKGKNKPVDSAAEAVSLTARNGREQWGGWGSNPRPADYEKYGLVHRGR